MAHKNVQAVLTPTTTLTTLAAEGKFASVEHTIPDHVHTMNPNITVHGEPFERY